MGTDGTLCELELAYFPSGPLFCQQGDQQTCQRSQKSIPLFFRYAVIG